MTNEQQKLKALLLKNLPSEMLPHRRFLPYFLKSKGNGAFAKIPRGSHSAPKHEDGNWCSFDEVFEKLRPGDGVGYCFTYIEGMAGGDILPFDFDHCRNATTGIVCNEAMIALSRWQSWSEISVSGCGLHVLVKGNIRTRQLSETCLQMWAPKHAPRFFALTGELVGPAFNILKDVGDDAQYVCSTAAHISAKIREELQAIDPDQWSRLPAEPEKKKTETREKAKTKTRKVLAGFDIKDFLNFYGLKIDNETDNDLGHCIRLRNCPLKHCEPHVGQNTTSTNFIYPCKDGGLAFHCNSTGCDKHSVHEAIAALEEDQGPYPPGVYENNKAVPRKLFLIRKTMTEVEYKSPKWVKRHVLMADALNMFVGLPDVGKSLMECCHMAELSRQGKKTLLICREDAYDSVWKPRLIVARANLDLIIPVLHVLAEDGEKLPWMLNDLRHLELFKEALLEEKADLGVIDPIADFMGTLDLNKATDVRRITGLLNPIAQETHTALLTSAHTTKAVVDSVIKVASGSIQLMAAVPCAWYLVKDPDNPVQRLMLQARNKHGQKRGFKYIVEGKDWPAECPLDDPADGEDGVGCVVMKGEETRTADELLERNSDKDNGAKTRIRRWLTEMLANGPVDTQQAGAEMSARGFSLSTVKDVCREMGVVRDGKTWSMKKKPQAVKQDELFDGDKPKENV